MNIKLFFKKHFTIPTYPYPCSEIMKNKYDLAVAKAKDKVNYVLCRDKYSISFLNHQTHEAYLRANLDLLNAKTFDHFMKSYDNLIDALLCQLLLKRRAKVDLNDPYQLLQDALDSRSAMTDGMITDFYHETVLSKKTEKGKTNGYNYFASTLHRYIDVLSFDNINTANSICESEIISINSIKWLKKKKRIPCEIKKPVIVTVAVIAVLCVIGSLGGETKPANTSTPVTESHAVEEDVRSVDLFISSFNEISDIPISDLSDIDVTDKDSDHYRVEFRLHAFKDSVSKTGICGESLVDIVTYGKEYQNIRVIVKDNNVENLAKIMKSCIMVLSPETPESEIDEICALFVLKKDASLLHLDDIKFTSHGKYNDSMDLCIIYE